ncbi:MAG: squalene/phytoene synthase family protein [Chromatiales bacterium]|jgi:phytoene synthase
MSEHVRFPNEATPLGSSAYYVVRFSRPDIQDTLATLFAWKQQLEQLKSINDPGVARLKLQWWREQLDNPTPVEHPLLRALQQIATQHSQCLPLCRQMADATDRLLRRLPPDDTSQAWQYFLDFGGSFAELLDLLVGRESNPAANQYGAWIQQVESIRNTGFDLRRGICLWPAQDLRRSGLGVESLLREEHTDQVVSLLQTQMAFADEQIANLPPVQRKTPLYRYYQLRRSLLRQLQQDNFVVMHQRISLTPLRKLWRAWW